MKPYLTPLLRRLVLRLLAPELSALNNNIGQLHAALSLLTLSQGGIGCKAGIPLEEMINIIQVSGAEAIRKHPSQALFIHELISMEGDKRDTLQ